MQLLIGTFSSGPRSIYSVRIAPNNSGITATPEIAAGVNPAWLVSAGPRLYAANELIRQKHGSHSSVRFFTRAQNGAYEQQALASTEADSSAHISVSEKHGLLFAANYDGGSISVFRLDEQGAPTAPPHVHSFEYALRGAGDSARVHLDRQEASHPHQVKISPCGNFLFVPDLGCDCIYAFEITPSKQDGLTLRDVISVPAGSGPRHMAFSDDGKAAYVSGELSSSVLVFALKEGRLTFVREHAVFPKEPRPYPRTSASEIAYYENRVYIANRGDDSIAVFSVRADGGLTQEAIVPCRGAIPRHFAILPKTPQGPLLASANQGSNNVAFFSIKGSNLTHVHTCENIPAPSCVHARQ